MTDDTPSSGPDEALALEIGHTLWFLQKGAGIADDEALRKAWAEDHIEMKKLGAAMIENLFARGVSASYFDRQLSHFGKSGD